MKVEHIVLNVHMKAVPGRERELESELRALLVPTRKELGCLTYELHRDGEDPHRFMFYEKFESQAALDAHIHSPHFQKFLAYRAAGSDPVASADVTRWSVIV
jgi:quinol monooxygenase YgiN